MEKTNIAAFTLIFSSFVMGISEFIVVGISSDIAVGIDVSVSMIGLLVSVFAVAYAIAAPLLMGITSKCNRFKLFTAFMIIFLASNLVSYLSVNYAMLAASRIITAAVCGAGLSLALSFVPRCVEPMAIPKYIALVFTGFSLACTIGMPLGNILCQSMGWRFPFMLVVILSIILLVMMFVSLPREDAPAWNADDGGNPQSNKGSIFKDPRIYLSMLFSFFCVGGAYVFFTYINPVMHTTLGLDDSGVTIGLLLFGVAALFSNVYSARFATKGGYKALRWVTLAQVAVFAIMFFALDNLYSGMIMIMCLGIVMYLMNSVNQIHFMEVAGRDYPASMNLASSFNPMSFNLGIAMGSVVGGLVMDNIGMKELALAAAAVSLIAFVMVVLICRVEKDPSKRTSLYDPQEKKQ